MIIQKEKNKKTLIALIEDDAIILKVLTNALKVEGFDVMIAKDGEEALVKIISDHPDLILLDFLLPKINGIDVLKKLREDSWGKDARVIVLTNVKDSEYLASTLEMGTYDYLIKSDWTIENVIKKVKEKLKQD